MRDVRKKSTGNYRNITKKCVVIKKDETVIPDKYYHVISLQNENNLIKVRTYGIHEEKKTEYLDPETCNIHPFDTEFLIKTLMLPIILYRLYNLLKSNDLRKSLINSIEAVGNWADVNFGVVNEEIRKRLQNLGIEYKAPQLPSNDIIKVQGKIISFSNKPRTQNPSPCPFSILTSLTLACAQDEIDLLHKQNF